MASIKLKGDVSGEVTISAPAVAGTTTLELPATSSTLATQNALGVRNLIINGDMKIAQRSTSVSGITTPAYYTVDRFKTSINGLGTWTQSQDTDAPDGFATSLKMACTTADASPAASDYLSIYQSIEGQNLQQLAYGTSLAKSFTISFWVKSNKTGTFNLMCLQLDNSLEMFSQSYTINAADTWEKKTITYTGDIDGVINNDNGEGLRVYFYLAAGSDRTSGSSNTEWSTYTTANEASSQVNLADSTSNYINITGVQLEVGDTATPFEHRPYDMELARCQRYYNRIYDIWCDSAVHVNGGRLMVRVDYPVQMRANPTVTTNTVSNTSCTFQSSNRTNTNGTHLYANSTTATGDAFFVVNNMESSAEL